MARFLNRIATRMWLLAWLVTSITLAVGISSYYLSASFEVYVTKERLPPGKRAELERLIATGQRGSDRYFELLDRYSDDRFRADDWVFLAIISALSTAIGGGAAFLFARRLSRPITAVAEATARVAAGDRGVRVEEQGVSGETGEMVRGFNRMAADIQAYERERTVLTAGIAHELRTPLTILRGRLHGLKDGVIDPAAGEADRLLRQVDALGRLVEDLRTLAHADAGELELDVRTVDLAHVAGTVVADLRQQATAAGVALVPDLSPASVRGDPLRLAQILTNLVTNAIKHAPEGTAVEVVTQVASGEAAASVSDAGPGFREEDRARLFMPFWRAGVNRDTGRPSSGMGLALAAKLAEAQGGRIAAENRPGRAGARFSLHLPLADREGPPPARRRRGWAGRPLRG